MFAGGISVGVVIGGAIMYYIQPQIKIAVAKAFGWEASAYADFQQLAAKVGAGVAAVKNTTAPPTTPTTK